MRLHARASLALAVLILVVATPLAQSAAAENPDPAKDAAEEAAEKAATKAASDAATAEAYRTLAAQVNRNTGMLAQLSTQIDATTARLGEINAAIVETTQKLEAARTEAARLQQIVRERAAYIYRRANQPQLAIGEIEHIEDVTSGKKYAESATRTDGRQIAELTRQAEALEAKRRDLDGQRVQQENEKARLENARVALAAVTARQQKVLDEAGAIPVMGNAELTADEIDAWFTARGVRYRLSGTTTMRELIELFLEEGAAEHIRPELAFAQAILETGSFGHALDNNYGGIGACDSCNGNEIAFPTPRDGVRGQMQLLRNFADPGSRAVNLANPPSPQIFGRDPAAAAARFDSYVAKGRIPTWNLMGNGNWATDPVYAPKVLLIYFDMINFAAKKT
ncbi:MAG: glucosaminidase domain-containing protein [Acidimicrobiia bacterium]